MQDFDTTVLPHPPSRNAVPFYIQMQEQLNYVFLQASEQTFQSAYSL